MSDLVHPGTTPVQPLVDAQDRAPSARGPYPAGRFLVMAAQCDQCLMTRRRIVSSKRAAQLLRGCRQRDVSFICHKSPRGAEIACRGHFDTGIGQMSRIAERLGKITEIDPVTLAPLPGRSEATITDGDAVPGITQKDGAQ